MTDIDLSKPQKQSLLRYVRALKYVGVRVLASKGAALSRVHSPFTEACRQEDLIVVVGLINGAALLTCAPEP